MRDRRTNRVGTSAGSQNGEATANPTSNQNTHAPSAFDADSAAWVNEAPSVNVTAAKAMPQTSSAILCAGAMLVPLHCAGLSAIADSMPLIAWQCQPLEGIVFGREY